MVGKALVVEDDPAIRMLISASLSAEHCEVVEAGDGQTALAAAARERPDVILLDIGLPDMDGLAVLQTLKGDPATRATPVVMVTAWADPDMVRQAMDRGASDYICKPFSIDDLLARVEASATAAPAPTDAVDASSGLPGRSHLEVVLARQAAAGHRTLRPFAVILVDVDGIETVIAEHDAAAGDEVLRAMAKRFRRRIGISDVIARYDTHTLAIVAPGLDLDGARARAEDLRAALAEGPLDTPAAPLGVTACFGAAAHETTEHPDQTLLRASDALCLAMAAGADAIRVDDPDHADLH